MILLKKPNKTENMRSSKVEIYKNISSLKGPLVRPNKVQFSLQNPLLFSALQSQWVQTSSSQKHIKKHLHHEATLGVRPYLACLKVTTQDHLYCFPSPSNSFLLHQHPALLAGLLVNVCAEVTIKDDQSFSLGKKRNTHSKKCINIYYHFMLPSSIPTAFPRLSFRLLASKSKSHTEYFPSSVRCFVSKRRLSLAG